MESKRRRVLVIDDEPSVVTYLVTLLGDNGYDTISAENGRAGLEKARQDRPDLVCLDVNMPEGSGIRFYRELKGDPDLAATPVIVITAVTGLGGDPEPVKHFLDTRKSVPPPEGFLAKPIDRQEFLELVANVLAGRPAPDHGSPTT